MYEYVKIQIIKWSIACIMSNLSLWYASKFHTKYIFFFHFF